MKRAVICVALWLLSVSVAAGQQPQPLQSLRGTVFNPYGKQIEGATVLLGKRSATTSASGQFRFDSLPPDKYPLVVRMVGFVPVHSRVAVVATEPTQVEYYLLPVPVVLPPIIVESKRTGIYGIVGDTAFHIARGAKVSVIGLNGGTVQTDSLGRFAFPRADRGIYMVNATYPGFVSKRLSSKCSRERGRKLC